MYHGIDFNLPLLLIARESCIKNFFILLLLILIKSW